MILNNSKFQLSLLFLIIQSATLFLFWQKFPPQVPLFYSRPWGKEQLAHPKFLLILPLGIIVISLVNIFMANFFFKKFPFLSQILSWNTVLISLLTTIAIIKIITLII